MPLDPKAVGLEGTPTERSWNFRDAIRHYALGEEGFCSWDGHLSMGLTIVDVITLGQGKGGKGGPPAAGNAAKGQPPGVQGISHVGDPSKPHPEAMRGAEARTRGGGRGIPNRPNFRPDDAPSGTRAINEHPDTGNIVHQIKKNLKEDGVGPNSWVGVAPNGDVIVANADGTAANLGSWWHYK